MISGTGYEARSVEVDLVTSSDIRSHTLWLRPFPTIASLVLLMAPMVYLAGCGDEVKLPSAAQLSQFRNAGPVPLTVDTNRLVKARIHGGPSPVVAGDVLELTIPSILRVLTAEDPLAAEINTPYICRVHDNGTITLPVVEQMQVAGKTLSQIESDITDAYYPAYAATRPAVFARVLEYRTQKVSISGAVRNPGIFELRPDHMSLVGLLMEAGGIIDEGAVCVRITHRDEAGSGLLKTNNANSRQTSGQLGIPAESRGDIYKMSTSDVSFIFRRQGDASRTSGEMKVVDSEGVVLFTEHMDIARRVERLTLLRELALRRPWASTAATDDKLRAMAESINSADRITRDVSSNGFAWPASFPPVNIPRRINGGRSGGSPVENVPLYKDIKQMPQKLVDVRQTEEYLGARREAGPLVLPIEGLNIPFADVALQDGDNVIVERLELPLFTVLGLVSRPGNFPYPPDVRYNLMQAIGFAGGLDRTAEPRYATVYRLTEDGAIASAVFKVVRTSDNSEFVAAVNTVIKPGDIVFVEHTPRTRTKVFLDNVFRINLGTYYQLNDAWGN